MAGGQTLIHDLPGVVAARPEAVILFHEEDDHPLDVAAWRRERDWEALWGFQLIELGISRGKNLIHDGPSVLEAARWLQGTNYIRRWWMGQGKGRPRRLQAVTGMRPWNLGMDRAQGSMHHPM